MAKSPRQESPRDANRAISLAGRGFQAAAVERVAAKVPAAEVTASHTDLPNPQVAIDICTLGKPGQLLYHPCRVAVEADMEAGTWLFEEA